MLKAGDHLWITKPGFQHHGIYIGNDRVIHFGSPGKLGSNQLRETSLDEFRKTVGLEVEVKVVCYKTCLPAEETVMKAKELLKNFKETGKILGHGYRLTINNCEHFATYCKTGKAGSHQIVRLTELVDDVAKELDRIEEEDGILIAVPLAASTMPIASVVGVARYAYGWSRDEIASMMHKSQNHLDVVDRAFTKLEDSSDRLGERGSQRVGTGLKTVRDARDPVEAGKGIIGAGVGAIEVTSAVAGLFVSTAARGATTAATEFSRGLKKLFSR